MNFRDDAAYRFRFAKGFLSEAEEDLKSARWRSCVSNSQLSVENSGKAIIAIFEPIERSHEPLAQINRLIDRKVLDATLVSQIGEDIPLFGELGLKEHFMAGYGDEANYKDPWQIFSKEDADEAFDIARRCFEIVRKIFKFYFPNVEW
ncbi:MAG: HEPN domain-containing protein [bacterium]